MPYSICWVMSKTLQGCLDQMDDQAPSERTTIKIESGAHEGHRAYPLHHCAIVASMSSPVGVIINGPTSIGKVEEKAI